MILWADYSIEQMKINQDMSMYVELQTNKFTTRLVARWKHEVGKTEIIVREHDHRPGKFRRAARDQCTI